MSTMTKAIPPRQYERSQMVGLAVAAVVANPAVAVPLRHELMSAVVGFEIMLLDFDAETEESTTAIAAQLADWRAEIDWAHYEVRLVIGAIA